MAITPGDYVERIVSEIKNYQKVLGSETKYLNTKKTSRSQWYGLQNGLISDLEAMGICQVTHIIELPKTHQETLLKKLNQELNSGYFVVGLEYPIKQHIGQSGLPLVDFPNNATGVVIYGTRFTRKKVSVFFDLDEEKVSKKIVEKVRHPVELRNVFPGLDLEDGVARFFSEIYGGNNIKPKILHLDFSK